MKKDMVQKNGWVRWTEEYYKCCKVNHLRMTLSSKICPRHCDLYASLQGKRYKSDMESMERENLAFELDQSD